MFAFLPLCRERVLSRRENRTKPMNDLRSVTMRRWALLLGVTWVSFAAGLSAENIMIQEDNMKELKCSLPNDRFRLVGSNAPGQVFVPFHYAEANANEVTQSAFDPFSREPNYKQSAARVEKAPREGAAR